MALYETTSELNIQSRFRFRHASEIKSIQKLYPIPSTQFDALFLIYFKLWEQHQNPSNYILRSQFGDVLYKCFNMPDDFLADQIQMALDKGASTNVTLKTWMKAICTTSSSGSSSSSSSDSDSSSSQERRDRLKSENADLSDNIDVVNTDKPDEKVTNDLDCVIFESDLDTDESETDEDFYDEHPQRLANQFLAEKRKQLTTQTCLSPMNSFDIPSTPPLPEEMNKEKKVLPKPKKSNKLGAITSNNVSRLGSYSNCSDFEWTQPDHHPPAELFETESKSFISPKPLPPHKQFQPVQPPIPPIRSNPILQQQKQQPPRVHHIAATQMSQHSEQSASDSESASNDDQTLQTSQPPQPPAPPPVPVPAAIPINFQSNQMRYPIMPPAGCRPAREGESVYCYCRCPYDEESDMIACDGSDCAIEWFHFECVNVVVPPKGAW